MLAYILSSSSLAIEIDSIAESQYLTDNMTLVSQGETFELGFFSLGNSPKRYLGIWYKKIPVQTVVWVANRDKAINGTSGRLELNNSTGNLVLKENETIIWNTTIQKQAKNPVLELLDSGNLVVRNDGDSNPDDYLWQSFDHPCDTQLQGMKIGRDLKNSLEWRLTPWKSPDDPSAGDFSYGFLLSDYPELSVMKGTKKQLLIGPWNGIYFSSIPGTTLDLLHEIDYVANEDEILFTFRPNIEAVLTRLVINQSSHIVVHYVWEDTVQSWKQYGFISLDVCAYGVCGPYGYCSVADTNVCQCLEGFTPKSPQSWSSSNWTQGCVRNAPLSCNNVTSTDRFVNYTGLKVPDTQYTKVDKNITLDECKELCLKNCSCMAYTNSNISGNGSGCVMWFGDLIDLKKFQEKGQNLFIRMSGSNSVLQHGHKIQVIIAATIAATFGMLLLCLVFRVRSNTNEKSNSEEYVEGYVTESDLPLLDLLTITTATDNFSLCKKIGQGGFGPVYRGKLPAGQEIAVKRLSHFSDQGITECITEVQLIAKLQHRNLVKLLGCCIQGQEKLLVYEYMVNGSLDNFIFDRTKSELLGWSQRFLIIYGVARGLSYLHHDSRLRIIHRDLKASNILLDENLNPKISDFGIAKAFGGDQTHGNTRRVIGT
ncbi:hypothetical protein PIB30_072207 [Stylosanthes scabra]|uniref:non-specific serine/threonine protein kinase n=1 Tax=Stylosanthes scabra TaxID=79078 RepID=A0ABU6SPQ8_9FABA|nr:hypothetical protein [Stylosanthes scabra]